MKKDYSKLAENIIELIGGDNNVVSLFHCATRLRFALKDKKEAAQRMNDVNKKLKGVKIKSSNSKRYDSGYDIPEENDDER